MNAVIAGLGAFIGGVFRYLILLLVKQTNFPVSMLIINALGSFIIGIVFALLKENVIRSNSLYIFLTTGILGGFTSFSAFSLDTINLFENGNSMLAALNIFLSVSVCLICVMAGKILASFFIN